MSTADKLVRAVAAKTANYTVTVDDFGKILTNRGATGAVTFTLPAVAASFAGVEVKFLVIADQTVTVAGTTGEVVAFNDPTANSVAFSTAGEKVGNAITAICDGTSWFLEVSLGAETATPTVAT